MNKKTNLLKEFFEIYDLFPKEKTESFKMMSNLFITNITNVISFFLGSLYKSQNRDSNSKLDNSRSN